MKDIDIAQACKMKPIADIAAELGIADESLELYGRYKAKVCLDQLNSISCGKLILVTAINPTPAGEGKTTTSVGLADAIRRLGKKSALALREPSLGPVFGVKGGAAGGGYSQVVPMEDINLHFTGDLHAITSANNLLAAMIDNHVYQGNSLNIDPRKITWRRCIDLNDRQLRYVVDGLNGKPNGVPREDGFDITAASEIMAVLCVSENIADLKRRLANIVVGYSYDNHPVTAGQLHAQGALTALLTHAIKPNLVQTLEGTPAFIHGGPFANIAHGCNSIVATRMALGLSDYAVTEAGFGADLGAEKFFDIKCRISGLRPNAVVVVATVKALKYHGGVEKANLGMPNADAVSRGMANLYKHLDNIRNVFGLIPVVAVNRFSADTQEELDVIINGCRDIDVAAVLSDVWAQGGEGGLELARAVLSACDTPNDFRFAYDTLLPIRQKIEQIAKRIYGADGVSYGPAAEKSIAYIEKNGLNDLPICMAKTQYSISDDPKRLGCPTGFTVTVRDVKVSAGAGFIVAITGEVMTMPGLPPVPSAENIDVDDDGRISGLF